MNIKHQATEQFRVIIPIGLRPYPDRYEELVARILAQKFQSDIIFVERGLRCTPDVQVVKDKNYWEIKNIRGNSKKTIEDNLRKASKQANNVVISLLRTTMTAEKASSAIRYYLSHARGNISRVILVTKRGKTIDFHV